ncbi:helix-turn-helix transcriptional regulator [Oceanivirga salmonicida]|uniref:helix-turn-helix transcriptional regulator n=1 Tax=Oceanivirga salmonicida TaxID=1769291 RepID=UPI00082AECB3|nr:helix-turn-helix transcriptional regulator [Oceanivirga salmonicida]
MSLCNKLKELRNIKGINQEEMGSLVGVSRQTISLIERGDYNPSIIVCLKLANVLEVSVEEIFWYEGE